VYNTVGLMKMVHGNVTYSSILTQCIVDTMRE
jgi:hypothetical protein